MCCPSSCSAILAYSLEAQLLPDDFCNLVGHLEAKKNEIRNSSHHYHLTGLQVRLRYNLAMEEEPSIERYKRIEKIKEEIREEWKKIRPAAGQNAFSRFQQEEVMSKQFFRRFKNKNANSNIGELQIVED